MRLPRVLMNSFKYSWETEELGIHDEDEKRLDYKRPGLPAWSTSSPVSPSGVKSWSVVGYHSMSRETWKIKSEITT